MMSGVNNRLYLQINCTCRVRYSNIPHLQVLGQLDAVCQIFTIWFFKRALNLGGLCDGEPPVPIPNTEAKTVSADDTWTARTRESRSSPRLSAFFQKVTKNLSDSLRFFDYDRYLFYQHRERIEVDPGLSTTGPGVLPSDVL
jgi:hypothetical protein